MGEHYASTAIPPGTVVIQYIKDNTHCVAVVVGNHMAKLLDWQLRKLTEDPSALHTSLVLGMYADCDRSWSAFAKHGFPHYIVAETRVTMPTELRDELNLCRSFADEGAARGMCSGTNVRRKIFRLAPQQEEALCLVALVQHYMTGGGERNLPDWIRASFENTCHDGILLPFFAELRQAIPLNASVSTQ